MDQNLTYKVLGIRSLAYCLLNVLKLKLKIMFAHSIKLFKTQTCDFSITPHSTAGIESPYLFNSFAQWDSLVNYIYRECFHSTTFLETVNKALIHRDREYMDVTL